MTDSVYLSCPADVPQLELVGRKCWVSVYERCPRNLARLSDRNRLGILLPHTSLPVEDCARERGWGSCKIFPWRLMVAWDMDSIARLGEARIRRVPRVPRMSLNWNWSGGNVGFWFL